MEYLKLFENHSQYENFTETEDFIKPNVSYCIEQNEVHYNPRVHDYSKDYLTFVALEDNVSFRFGFGTIQGFELSYSLDDGSTWNIFEDQKGNTVTINRGEKILWKGQVIPTRGTLTYKIGTFYSQGRFNVMGNIMSLAYSDDFVGNNQLPENMGTYFISVFEGSSVVSAENLILPATTLATACYNYMFEDCINLIVGPELPATTLAERCYNAMFRGCTSLTTAPELPATTLANWCYQSMFEGCTSLTTEAQVPSSIAPIADNYCSSMYCECPIRQISGNYPEVAYNCSVA